MAGASADQEKWGGRILSLLDDCKFEGRVYPVNQKVDQIGGRKCYPSVRAIPEPVDLVMVTVPAEVVPTVIADCVANGSIVAQIISSGFSEVGESGRILEGRVLEAARGGGLRLIGPNCMGIYSAVGRLSMTHGAHHRVGRISVISQSGGLSNDILLRGQRAGLMYNKIVSVGNCLDLDASDFLEHLMEDNSTTAVGLYIESSKHGRRLKELLEAITRKNPVVLLKGGRTVAGTKSVSSHTGNLAGSYATWQAMCRQTKVIEVKTLDEFVAALVACQYIKALHYGGVALLGNGGGATVLACDTCEELGLELASLSPSTQAVIGGLTSIEGGVGNPLDLPTQRLIAKDGGLIANLVQAFCADSSVSSVVFHLNMGSGTFQGFQDPSALLLNIVNNLASVDRKAKVVAIVLRSNGARAIEEIRDYLMAQLQSKGFPVFQTTEQAFFALTIAGRLMRRAN